MLWDGHQIGNHTYSHKLITRLPDAEAWMELNLTQEMLRNTTGYEPEVWRAPYLDTNSKVNRQAARLGLRHVGATIDTYDFRVSADEIVERAMAASDGDVILLHDGIPPNGGSGTDTRQATVDALPSILELPFQFVTVGDL